MPPKMESTEEKAPHPLLGMRARNPKSPSFKRICCLLEQSRCEVV